MGMFCIVNGSMNNKLYLTEVQKAPSATWGTDAAGKIVCKQRRCGRKDVCEEGGYQTVGRYKADVAEARKFRTREKAEKLIAETPVLRFCRVEEVGS